MTGSGTGAAAAAGPVRAAAARAVHSLLDEADRAAGPGVLCVGPGERTRRHPAEAWGTLGGYGVAVEAPARHAATPPALPLSLTVARLLLDAAGWAGPVVLVEVDHDATPASCAELGAGLRRDHPGAAWLVPGDASAARTARAPGALDPRAAPFDAQVARALELGDARALLGIDPVLAAELGAAGRAAWQVLAGAAAADGLAPSGALLYDDAPYGVGYLVARWRPAEPS